MSGLGAAMDAVGMVRAGSKVGLRDISDLAELGCREEARTCAIRCGKAVPKGPGEGAVPRWADEDAEPKPGEGAALRCAGDEAATAGPGDGAALRCAGDAAEPAYGGACVGVMRVGVSPSTRFGTLIKLSGGRMSCGVDRESVITGCIPEEVAFPPPLFPASAPLGRD